MVGVFETRQIKYLACQHLLTLSNILSLFDKMSNASKFHKRIKQSGKSMKKREKHLGIIPVQMTKIVHKAPNARLKERFISTDT